MYRASIRHRLCGQPSSGRRVYRTPGPLVGGEPVHLVQFLKCLERPAPILDFIAYLLAKDKAVEHLCSASSQDGDGLSPL